MFFSYDANKTETQNNQATINVILSLKSKRWRRNSRCPSLPLNSKNQEQEQARSQTFLVLRLSSPLRHRSSPQLQILSHTDHKEAWHRAVLKGTCSERPLAF